MVVQEQLYTADDLFILTAQSENRDRFFELIDGVIHEMSPSSAKPSTLAIRIARFVGGFVDERHLGFVSGADGGFELSPKNVLVPDVGFISYARAPQLPERYFQGAADLAIEVVSPTDSIRDVLRKARKYLQYGTKRVWIFYPDDESADVCRLAPDGGMIIDEVGRDGVLDGEDVLPGFSLPLRDLFPKQD